MEERVKRGGISALLMSSVAPGAGLVYTHRPLQAFICALIILLCLSGDAFFQSFASPQGLMVSLALICAAWLYSLLVTMATVGRGLSLEQVRRDSGPWIVFLLFVNLVSLGLFFSRPYTVYSSVDSSISSLAPGESFLALTGAYDIQRNSLGGEHLTPGSVMLLTDGAAEISTRLWGMPGDVLELRDGVLFRNGKRASAVPGISLPSRNGVWVVPEEFIFVWSDNATEPGPGAGARHIGSVRGKALYICWSRDKSRLGTTVE